MSQQHTMLTRKDLSARWNVSIGTINNWIAEKKIKPSKITNLFPIDYIEAIERTDIDLDTVNAFTLRAKERRIEQLEQENAMLKSTLLQVVATANEAAAQMVKSVAV